MASNKTSNMSVVSTLCYSLLLLDCVTALCYCVLLLDIVLAGLSCDN